LGASTQVAGKIGGVNISIGSKAGAGDPLPEGITTAIEVGDTIEIGSATGTVDKPVAVTAPGTLVSILTIGGIEGESNIFSNAAIDAWVYQIDNANTIIAAGKLETAASSTDDTYLSTNSADYGKLRVITKVGTFSNTATGGVLPDLRITAAGVKQQIGSFNESALERTDNSASVAADLIKRNNVKDKVGVDNTARQELKLLSTVDDNFALATSISVTLGAGSPQFTAEGYNNIIIKRGGNDLNVQTQSGNTLKILGVAGGSLSGTLANAVNLYITEF